MKGPFYCEECNATLSYKGGPFKPRWCELHREDARTNTSRERMRRHRARIESGETLTCDGCRWVLQEPSDDGLCGFCREEIAMADAQVAA